MSRFYELEVPVLVKETYMTWKSGMKKYLIDEKLWDHAKGRIPKPEITCSPEYEDWLKKEAKTRRVIKNSCGAKAKLFIEGLDTKYIWKQLVIMHEHNHVPGMKDHAITNYTWCLPFYDAIVDGDLKAVLEFHSANKGAITARLTSTGEIPLYVAARAQKVTFVKELVSLMEPEDVKIQEKTGRTALHAAASIGNLEMVMALVNKNKSPVMVMESPYCSIPIVEAARAENKREVVNYLYWPTKKEDKEKKEKIEQEYREEKEKIEKKYQDEKEKIEKDYQSSVISQDKKNELRAAWDKKELEDKEAKAMIVEQNRIRATIEQNRIRATLLTSLIFGEQYDLAYDLLHTYGEELLLTKDEDRVTAVLAISTMPSGFGSSFIAKDRSGYATLAFKIREAIYSVLHIENSDRPVQNRDVENYGNAPDDTVDGPNGDGIIHGFCKILYSCSSGQVDIPGLGYFKDIYNMKLKHYRAKMLLGEIWKLVSSCEDLSKIENDLKKAMFQATEFGIVEFIDEIVHNCPHFLRETYPIPEHPPKTETETETEKDKEKPTAEEKYDGQTIFHYAISNRQEQIFSCIDDLPGPMKDDIMSWKDRSGNYMSHLAAKKGDVSSLNRLPHVPLQVRRELQWYKEVERIMSPALKNSKDSKGKTARNLFTEEHKELVEAGATWMKETAQQCMVVAVLVATVMFQLVFEIRDAFGLGEPEESNTSKTTRMHSILPGGSGESKRRRQGYINSNFSVVFVTTDILGLISSVASTLIFLAIITTTYSENDFLRKLPRMLVMALFCLFLSLVAMMMTFVEATLVLFQYNDRLWVSTPVIFLATVPVLIYILVQIPLFIELMTFSRTIFISNSKTSRRRKNKREDVLRH